MVLQCVALSSSTSVFASIQERKESSKKKRVSMMIQGAIRFPRWGSNCLMRDKKEEERMAVRMIAEARNESASGC